MKSEEQAVYSGLNKEEDTGEILEGLSRTPKTLPSKFFYDKKGSELFEKICSLDEYYLTRAEMGLMENYIDDIARELGAEPVLIEFGSGSSRKTRLLLDHLKNVSVYIPIDISEEFLEKEAEKLQKEYPDLTIKPLALDYTQPFSLPQNIRSQKKVIYFPGSTIGNFKPGEAKRFLEKCANLAGENGGLLIGVDTKKDPEMLEAAYNDSRRITAAFNKNILDRLNSEFSSDFEPDAFEHRAVYNEQEGRVEMHLVSLRPQKVIAAGKEFTFEEGEKIITEYSYKYAPEEFEEMASDYFNLKRFWTGEDNLFGIYYLVPKA